MRSTLWLVMAAAVGLMVYNMSAYPALIRAARKSGAVIGSAQRAAIHRIEADLQAISDEVSAPWPDDIEEEGEGEYYDDVEEPEIDENQIPHVPEVAPKMSASDGGSHGRVDAGGGGGGTGGAGSSLRVAAEAVAYGANAAAAAVGSVAASLRAAAGLDVCKPKPSDVRMRPLNWLVDVESPTWPARCAGNRAELCEALRHVAVGREVLFALARRADADALRGFASRAQSAGAAKQARAPHGRDPPRSAEIRARSARDLPEIHPISTRDPISQVLIGALDVSAADAAGAAGLRAIALEKIVLRLGSLPPRARKYAAIAPLLEVRPSDLGEFSVHLGKFFAHLGEFSVHLGGLLGRRAARCCSPISARPSTWHRSRTSRVMLMWRRPPRRVISAGRSIAEI